MGWADWLTMRGMISFFVAAALVLATSPAGAQGAPEVPAGGSFTIENGPETACEPNSEVVAGISSPDGEYRQIGAAIADPAGRFSMDARLPASQPLGATAITVDCGLQSAVLAYDIVVVAPTSSGSLMDLAPYVAIAIVVLVLVAFVVSRRRRSAGDAPPAQAETTADSLPSSEEAPLPQERPEPAADGEPDPLAALTAPEADGSDVVDDNSEYWFWDNQTDRGPVKRVACLSEEGFYLHEVPANHFSILVGRLARVGPDEALRDAFFSVPVAAIDEVHHRGTQLRVVFVRNGEKLAQVIDLGTEVTEVVDLLSRRVHVVASPPVGAS